MAAMLIYLCLAKAVVARYDELCTALLAVGIPLTDDRKHAWRDFVGWYVNDERALLSLCTLTMAPDTPWSADRAPAYRPLPL